jgi:hypothetical protein
MGAVSDLNTSGIPCARTVWVYDPSYTATNGWALYQTINSTNNNYNYPQLSTINQGQGFWVEATCNDTITFVDGTPVSGIVPMNFTMFNLNWTQTLIAPSYKPLVTYLGDGNTIVPSDSNITLSTSKVAGYESRTQIETTVSSMGAEASLMITDTATGYNKTQLRTHSDVYIPDDIKTSSGLQSNNVTAQCMITITGKKMSAQVYLTDGTKDVEVYNQNMYYDETTMVFLNNQLDLKIVSDDTSVTFSAISSNSSISIPPVTFTRPAGVVSYGVKTIKLRTKIDDDDAIANSETSGDTVSAQIYNVTPLYAQNDIGIDINTTALTDSSKQVLFTTFTTGIDLSLEKGWFGAFSYNPTDNNLTITDYDYDGTTWQSDTPHSGTITINNSDTNATFNSDEDSSSYNIVFGTTEKITAIDGNTSFGAMDLYKTPMTITVLDGGDGWTDSWGWAPMDYNTTTPITTNQQLLDMYLTQNNWFDDSTYAMLDGTIGATSGDIVSGYVTGTFACDNDGDSVQDDICQSVAKSSTVIGSWTFDTNGIHLDMPFELQTLSMVADSSSPTGYFVQSYGVDKVGSVWQEYMITGADLSVEATQTLLSK